MFYVGQKVVCIVDATAWRHGRGEIKPQKGSIYTVRTIMPSFRFRGEATIMLVEIVNKPREYAEGFVECSFRAIRFRPVVERKTDISIFQKLLDPANHRQLEGV